jgi:aryl-alcohol dehydrogenase-like predicted oxidoreductase
MKEKMEYIQLPHLKSQVSRIALGTWAIGGWMWGGADEKESIATIRQALDRGINIIDTAPVYGFGVSEEVVGKALKQYGKRDQVIIATKVGLSWKDGKVFRDARKETIFNEIEASLKRLQTDYIDLYQVHWPDPLTPISETAQALNSLLKAGKIRSIGVSNFSVEQIKEFKKSAPLHALQSPYNLFERSIEKNELPFCITQKIMTLGYGPLCRGLLSGKMNKEKHFSGDDLRKIDPKFQEPRFSQYLACVDKLQEWVQHKYERSVLALSLRWVLDKNVNFALWGARKPEQLQGLESVFGWHLTPTDFEEIDKIINDTVLMPVGPEFMAPPARK